MKGLKENKYDEKEKFELSKLTQVKPLQRNSPKRSQTRLGEFTPEKLSFLSSNLPKRELTYPKLN